MKLAQALTIAKTVIENGLPFEATYLHEGSVETGPYTTKSFGIQHNGFKVTMTQTGHIYLESKKWIRIDIPEWNIQDFRPAIKESLYTSRIAADEVQILIKQMMEEAQVTYYSLPEEFVK